MKNNTGISTQAFQILLALSDREMHGYAIIKDIRDRTGGEFFLTASTLYSAVKRMLRDKWINEAQTRPAPELDDQRRTYFGITPAGKEVLRAEVHRLEQLIRLAKAKPGL